MAVKQSGLISIFVLNLNTCCCLTIPAFLLPALLRGMFAFIFKVLVFHAEGEESLFQNFQSERISGHRLEAQERREKKKLGVIRTI